MTNIYGDNDTNMCMAQLKLLTTKVQQITIITVQHTINDTRTMSSVPSMSGGVPHDTCACLGHVIPPMHFGIRLFL